MEIFKHLFISFTLALLVSSCGLLHDASENEYPTTLRPLSNGQVLERTRAFHQANKYHVCSQLNEFGLTIGDGCFGPKEHLDITLNEEQALETARDALVRNRAYTNVVEPDEPRLRRAAPIGQPAGSEWKVDFLNQVHDGIEVHKTRVIVWLNAAGIYRIEGHWYEGITRPISPIERSEALRAAIGHEITYSDWGGHQVLNITEEMLPPPEDVTMSVLPFRTDDGLELRVVWEFQASIFILFVDSVEGDILEHRQTIVF